MAAAAIAYWLAGAASEFGNVGCGNPEGVGQFESLLWERREHRVRPRAARRPARWIGRPLTEWNARPLGRLGRPLVSEIEAYLEFFAIARTGENGRHER